MEYSHISSRIFELPRPLAGILISDFYFVHKQKYDVRELYDFHGIYRYKYGFNRRAFLAFTIGWVPLLPGFIPTVSSITVVEGMVQLYNLDFFYGVGAAGLSYYLICYFFPAQGTYVARPVYMNAGIVSEEDVESSTASEKRSA
ncbi:hypothetical protein V1524DRAFT_409996 [Lipomyces starkeyi]